MLNGGDNSSLKSEDIKAIFLNYFKTASPIKKKDEYPSYFIYSYNIIDPVKYHKECIADGYFEKANFEQIIESYKVNELKALIEKYNIKTKKNNKKEMCENINLQLPNEIKNEIVNKSEFYVLSNKALLYIDEYTELLTLNFQ